MSARPEILYLSHGAGPLPLLGDPDHRTMVDQLVSLAGELKTPAAVLVISAHWEEAEPTITAGEQPGLIYDYSGFPPESYEIRYPCAGEPALAGKIHETLHRAGIKSRLNQQRGFDHGTFVPLKIMYPEANIPCVQLSLVKGLDPETHLSLGESLQELDYENLLVIGSGFSFHNMREFFLPDNAGSRGRNEAFQQWLEETCAGPGLSEADRRRRLAHWTDAPHARFCHPREEHLLPLHVCYGMAGRPAEAALESTILGKESRTFFWGKPDTV